jgi:hypothetical protein
VGTTAPARTTATVTFVLLTVFELLTLVSTAERPTVQPSIAALVRPAPNRFGWNNSPVTISYTCHGATSCPDPIVVSSEGAGQVFKRTVTDEEGRSATASTEVDLDLTPAAIALTSPDHMSSTTAAAATISAHVSDAASGIAGATCNGDPAVPRGGEVSCIVPLRDGVNDLIVQVTDRAGNSSSTGVQVHRVGTASSIIVVPSQLTMHVGQIHSPQVVDNFGRTISDVTWEVDGPPVVSFGDDTTTLVAEVPGITTVRAKSGALTASMDVRVMPGESLPEFTDRWTVGHLPGYRESTPPDFIVTAHLTEYAPMVLSFEHEMAGPGVMLRAIDSLPRQLWIEAPAMSPRERIGEQLSGDHVGGGLFRVDTTDGRSHSLIRVGRPEQGTLWRYTPDGRLADGFSAGYDGIVEIVETTADGYPALVLIDGMTGSAKSRIPVPRSSVTSLNAGCVSGADSTADRPAEVGGPTVLLPDTVNLAFSTTRDVEDALPCGKGTVRRQRTIHQMQVSPDGQVTYRTIYEYPPMSGDPIEIALSRVLPDGHGGQLVAWSARIGRQPVEYTMVRVTDDRLIPFRLPALGETVVGMEDLAVTTDGRTIVGFDVTSGQILWLHHAPPNGTFRALHALDSGGLRVITERGLEYIDRAGHRTLLAEQSR